MHQVMGKEKKNEHSHNYLKNIGGKYYIDVLLRIRYCTQLISTYVFNFMATIGKRTNNIFISIL